MTRRSAAGYCFAARIEAKDQSYFLFGLTQDQLSKTRLSARRVSPKPEVREIARRAGLHDLRKSGVAGNLFCSRTFVCRLRREVRRSRGETSPGDIVTENGEVVGTHGGIHKYTVGQRKGLIAAGRPQYVVRIETEANQIVIGE